MTSLSKWREQPGLADEFAKVLNLPVMRIAMEVLWYESRHLTTKIEANPIEASALLNQRREGAQFIVDMIEGQLPWIPRKAESTHAPGFAEVQLRDENAVLPKVKIHKKPSK